MNNLLPALIEACPEGDSKEEKPENALLNAASEISVVDTLRREVNTAKALLRAEEELQNDTQEPPAAKVDDDWLFR
jgi:hypothetical protein